MIYKIATIATLAAALAAKAAAHEHGDCEFAADCSSGTCITVLDTCNWQGEEDQYTDSGIPCGTVYDIDLPCIDGAEPIATVLQDVPLEALEAFQAAVDETLPIGVDNTAELDDPDNLVGAFLVTELDQTINATFLDEGACFLNTIGMITWDAELVPGKAAADYDEADRVTVLEGGKMTIFFPNADSKTCQVALDPVLCPPGDAELLAFCTDTDPFLPLGTTVPLKPYPEADSYVFPVGTYVSFFLVPDGFVSINKGGPGFNDTSGTVHFTLDNLNVAAENNPQNSITSLVRKADFATEVDGVPIDFSRFLLVTWEDNINNDFQDTVILIETEPAPPSCIGVLNSCGDICCPAVCGVCGGCETDCAALSEEFGVECCPGAIRESDIFCGFADEGCIVPGVDPCEGGNCDRDVRNGLRGA